MKALFLILIFSSCNPINMIEMNEGRSIASCFPVHFSCREDHHCCSGKCIDNNCAEPMNIKGGIGADCNDYSDCESRVCYKDRCLAAPNSGIYARVGQYCTDGIASMQCKSGYCNKENYCMGSKKDPATIGQPCDPMSSGQCASKNCALWQDNIHICVGSKYDPGYYGELCIENRNCKSRRCNKGFCQ